MIVFGRRPGFDRSEFVRWWLDDHNVLAAALPGLEKIVANVVAGGDHGIDGIAELWFSCEADFIAARDSKQGGAAMADAMMMAARLSILPVSEHEVARLGR